MLHMYWRQSSISVWRCGALHVGDHVLSADGISFTDGLPIAEAAKLVTANASSQIQLEVVPAALVREDTEPLPASAAPSVDGDKSTDTPAPGLVENAPLWSTLRWFLRVVIRILVRNTDTCMLYSVSQKNPPAVFLLFSKRLGIFNQFLHNYYTLLSTIDYQYFYSVISNFDEVMPN